LISKVSRPYDVTLTRTNVARLAAVTFNYCRIVAAQQLDEARAAKKVQKYPKVKVLASSGKCRGAARTVCKTRS